MKKIALMSLVASSVLMAGGYKIPETSLNGVALSAANIAHNKSADAAYYNPANMVFMQDTNHVEVDLLYIGLDAVNFKGKHTAAANLGGATTTLDTNAESENFILPAIHYVSGAVSGARFGLSVHVPGGLSKRWTEQPAKGASEEFTLEVVEVNPTIALPIGDTVAVAVGVRLLHSSGVVKATPVDGVVSQDMTGDSVDFGYNIALAYKPMPNLEFGITYRSRVDLTEEGDADLKFPGAAANPPYPAVPAFNGNYGARVMVPLPATVSVAAAYTFSTKTTVELVYEKNYWSAYDSLDFDFDYNYGEGVFGKVKTKDWNDTSAYRLGITQELSNMTLMAGIVYDETPVPNESLNFELPDSDSLSISLGGRYQINDAMDIGLSALYSMREERTIKASDNDNGLDGKFSNSNVLIISAGVGYKF
jgi:long-chain fatty acid transport protein